MGDVAMTVPVIKNLLQQNPALQITVVSNAFFEPLFQDVDRCNFHPAHLKKQHKGLAGIFRLYKELKTLHQFDAVADLHSVLRSFLLKSFFKISGIKNIAINKGRKEKKLLTQKENKQFHQLPSSFQRYADVFMQLGYHCVLKNEQPVYSKKMLPATASHFFSPQQKTIGIAPFAQHIEKMYPLQKMKHLAAQLHKEGWIVLLFGGGKEEALILQSWQDEIAGNVFNIAGKFSLTQELAIISHLNKMISMDSANMHLASLFGVEVISVWGATHPFAGFYGWGQNISNMVSIDLPCRPCAVFGNKPCWRGDHACMQMITESMITEKTQEKPPI